MKKILSIALVATAFALVGCSAHKKPIANEADTTINKVVKGKKHHVGKLGVEKIVKDTAK